MSKEELKHIFEHSSCLTQRQLKGYVSGKMVHEEAHAVEAHLLSCPLCNDAVEGMMAGKADSAIAGMEKLNADFLAQHLGIPVKEIKAATPPPPATKQKAFNPPTGGGPQRSSRAVWKPMAAAAAFLAIVAVMWLMRDTIFPQGQEQKLAQEIVVEEPKASSRPMEVLPTTDTEAVAMAEEAVEEITTALDPNTESAASAMQPGALAAEQPKTGKEELKKSQLAMTTAAKTEASRMTTGSLQQTAATKDKSNLDVAASAPKYDGAQRMGNSFTGPQNIATTKEATAREELADEAEVKKEAKVNPVIQEKLGERARSGIDKGDELYNKGKYKRALKAYQDEMYDSRSNKRDGATYMAAKCHLAMGEETQARTLLNSLIHSNSSKKGQAEELLRNMNP